MIFLKLNFKIDNNQIVKISEMYINYLSSFSFLYEGAFDLLDYLNKKYSLHIISNGFEDVQKRKIKNSGFYNFRYQRF